MMHVTGPYGGIGGNRVIGGAGSFSLPSFWLQLDDAGNGAVNTTPGIGIGPATFTRATAAACRLGTGLWKLDVASGVARSHYWEFTPGVYTYGGYLSEPAATQLLLDPRDMTTANWVLGATMTRAKNQVGIDGTANSATLLTGGAVSATNTILQTVTAAASSRTYSAFVKRVTGTGTITLKQGTATLDITALINTTSYTQVQLNDSELNVAIGFQITTNGDQIAVDCNQFEAGAVATTPIPSAGTRNADVLKYATTGNTSQTTGTIYAEYCGMANKGPGADAMVLSLDDGSGSNRINLRIIGGSPVTTDFIVVSGGATQVDTAGGNAPLTSINKQAASYATNNFAASVNGATPDTDSSGSLPTFTSIQIGSLAGVSTFLGGTVKNVRIWKSQLSNDQLQTITA